MGISHLTPHQAELPRVMSDDSEISRPIVKGQQQSTHIQHRSTLSPAYLERTQTEQGN